LWTERNFRAPAHFFWQDRPWHRLFTLRLPFLPIMIKLSRNITAALLTAALLWPAPFSAAHAEVHDLVIYGGTAAGIAAAVQVKRMGGSAIVIEPTARVGGLTTGGLGQTDIGNKHVIGGIAREFYRDIRVHYRRPEAWKWQPMPAGAFRGGGQTVTEDTEETQWTFEPSAALSVLQSWIARDGIVVIYGERLERDGKARRRTAATVTSWPAADPSQKGCRRMVAESS
jgi:hypothetical protein